MMATKEATLMIEPPIPRPLEGSGLFYMTYVGIANPWLQIEIGAHLLHGQDTILASKPDTLDVNILSKVPDLLLGSDGVVIIGMHDAGVVELIIVL